MPKDGSGYRLSNLEKLAEESRGDNSLTIVKNSKGHLLTAEPSGKVYVLLHKDGTYTIGRPR